MGHHKITSMRDIHHNRIFQKDQKEPADLHSKICVDIGRGRILVNRETRFAKMTMVGKDGYRVNMKFHMKNMSCRREKGVLIWWRLAKEIGHENVIKILALLKVSAAISFDERVMSCVEPMEAAQWSEDESVSAEPRRARTDDIFLKLLTEKKLSMKSLKILSTAVITQMNDPLEDRGALMREIAREADNMLWMWIN
ncbi:BTB/POZ domain-containing protein [Raphanus sativus]|nr:BTB/POZ domain-containing protein [Raphanus sativus]